MGWSVELLNADVAAELEAQPADIRAKLVRFSNLVASGGLLALREPAVKHLRGKLWEIRLSGRDGIARAIYVTASGQRVVIVRIFTKKTDKTPSRELELAEARAKDVK